MPYVLCVVTQLRPTLCDSMDCSLPGSSVHGTLQAKIPEWVAMPSSRGSSHLMSPAMAGGFFTTSATQKAQKHTTIHKTHQQQGPTI